MTGLELGIVELATVTWEMAEKVPVHVPLEKRLYVTVPPALLVEPVNAAESYAELPTVIVVEDRLVAIDTPFGLTVRGSQALLARLLFASPLYAAFQLTGAVLLKVTDLELGTTAFVTVTVDTTEGDPEHVPLVKRLYETVPPAVLVAPVIVAESKAKLPTVIVVADRLVVMLTSFWLTVRGSQALMATLLFTSPLYTAFQLYGPAMSNVLEAEFGTIPFDTATGDPTTVAAPPQVEPEKKLYVTVPPAWKLFVRVAESVTELPTIITFCERAVVIVGLALFTVRDSQGLVARLLFASPL